MAQKQKQRSEATCIFDNKACLLGFVPLHRDGAEILFNVVAQAFERQSIIVTSSSCWSKYSVIVKKLLFKGYLLNFALSVIAGLTSVKKSCIIDGCQV